MKQAENSVDPIGPDIRNRIKEIGRLWKESESSLKIVDMKILDSWEQLILSWAKNKNMPLIIRKGNARGQEFEHSSGRKIVISDNTFALWVYRNALGQKEYTLDDIKQMLDDNKVPMVYALTKEEKEKAKYTRTLGEFSISNWKLCHIKPVGLNSRKHIKDIEIEKLIECFKRYANPKNMFVLPKEIGGLGEIQEFIDEQVI